MSFSSYIRDYFRTMREEVTEEELDEYVEEGRVRDMGIVEGCQMYVVTNRALRRRWFGRVRTWAVAFQIDDCILFRDFNSYRNAGIRAHEAHHIRQRNRYGDFWFPVLYGLGQVGCYYLNPMEVTANIAGWRAKRSTR